MWNKVKDFFKEAIHDYVELCSKTTQYGCRLF